MPDECFAHPRLARIYDELDGERSDLVPYAALVDEFGADRVLDVGCGTGTFACLLASAGRTVVAVDPAPASLDIAGTKPGAEQVCWLHGDATTLPPLEVDVATMTANVAQVFLTDDAWHSTLAGIHGALRPAGHLVFEVRDPQRRAWERWRRETSYRRVAINGVGVIATWVDVTGVALPFVSFRQSYCFESDGAVLTSDSTLRFRPGEDIASSLAATGFRVIDVRDAPDRPGCELVFVAQRERGCCA